MKKSNVILKLTLFIFFVLFVSCNNPEKDFEKAKDAHTKQAYKEFINKYSEGEYVILAQEAIEAIEWDQVQSINTVEFYTKFIDRNPNSTKIIEAKNNITKIENVNYLEKLLYCDSKYVRLNINQDSHQVYTVDTNNQKFSPKEFRTKFHWNGEKISWNWGHPTAYIKTSQGKFSMDWDLKSPDNGITFKDGHRKLNGRSGLGNILFDGAWQWVADDGIEIYPGTKVIYPK